MSHLLLSSNADTGCVVQLGNLQSSGVKVSEDVGRRILSSGLVFRRVIQKVKSGCVIMLRDSARVWYAGEARLAVCVDGARSASVLAVQRRLAGRNVRHHHTGTDALRRPRSDRN